MSTTSQQPLLEEGQGQGDAKAAEGFSVRLVGQVAAALIAVAVLAGVLILEKDKLVHAKDDLINASKALGPFAAVVIFLLCWVTTSLSGPAFIWEMSGSILFQQMWGAKVALVAGMLSCGLGIWCGCITVFVLGRKWLKPKVKHVIDENDVLRIINRIIEKEGWQFAFVMRLNPLIPFEALNLACSMTDLSLLDHAIASIGTMPIVCFEVYTAVTAAEMGSATEKTSKWEPIIKGCIGLLLIAVMAFYAKKKYDKEAADLDESNHKPSIRTSVRLHRSLSSF